MEPIHVQGLLTPSRLEPVLCKREKPLRWEARALKLEGGPCSDEDPAQPNTNTNTFSQTTIHLGFPDKSKS